MEIGEKLEKAIIDSVKGSMLIEGFKSDQSESVKEQARQLMKQHHFKVSGWREVTQFACYNTPSKIICG